MAAIKPTITELGKTQDGSIKRIIWNAISSSDTCSAVEFPEYADKSIQVWGTFNNAAVAVHGSNDGGTTFAALNDPGGTVISITAAGIKGVLENTQKIQPILSGGGASQNLNIAIVARLANPLRT